MEKLEGYINDGVGGGLKVGAEVTFIIFEPLVKSLKDPVRRRWHDATKGRRRYSKLEAKQW